MKFIFSFLFAAAVLLILTGSAHAQFISWSGPFSITGDSDIKTNGSYVDAFQAASAGAFGKDGIVETANTVAFNPNSGTNTDGTITLSGNMGPGSDGYAPGGSSSAYQAILADCQYTGGVGTVTLGSVTNPLVVGDEYQVQVWNSTPYDATSYTGSTPTDTITAPINTYEIGTFTATGTTASFTVGAPPAGTLHTSGAYVVDAISLRDIPEPSTYAMLIGGLALLGFCVHRRAASIS